MRRPRRFCSRRRATIRKRKIHRQNQIFSADDVRFGFRQRPPPKAALPKSSSENWPKTRPPARSEGFRPTHGGRSHQGGRPSENRRLKDNICIPAQLNAKDQATYVRLSQLSGTAFDRAYARDMVRDHESRHCRVSPRSKRRQGRDDQELCRANLAHFGRSLETGAPDAPKRLAKNQRANGEEEIPESRPRTAPEAADSAVAPAARRSRRRGPPHRAAALTAQAWTPPEPW